MRRIFNYLIMAVIAVAIILWLIFSGSESEAQVIKIGYFPNITHSQALVGMAKGEFQKALGDEVKIEVKTFNAGPSEIEAMFAGEIDLGYIGPSPAINGYIKSKGEALKIIAGATSGGASLIVQPELAKLYEKEGAKALIGKKIASPQQGNTQDISLRHFLKENGLSDKAQIVPIANADQLTMFSQNKLDGAWAPEPWATRLVQEANGVRIIDERKLWPNEKFCTANIIVRSEFLEENPELVEKWLKAHMEITNWINANSQEAQAVVNAEIERITTKKLPEKVLEEAWTMLDVVIDPLKDSVMTFADWAFEQGFLGEAEPDLSGLYYLDALNEISNNQFK